MQPLVTTSEVFRLWRPLAATLLLMAVEIPLITGFVARRDNAQVNLAALGVCFGIALLFEAPVLRFLSAAISLVSDRLSFLKYHRFVIVHLVVVVLFAACIASDPLRSVLLNDIMDLPKDVQVLIAEGAYSWILFPVLVGYRRLYQGILIRARRARLVSLGTLVRLLSMCVCLVFLHKNQALSGLALGVYTVTLGLSVECVVTLIFAVPHVKVLLAHHNESDSNSLGFYDIARFYYPLAVSSIVLLLAQPVESYFLAQGREPILSLALLPVLHGLLNPFTWSGFGVQDTALAFLTHSKLNYIVVRRFALYLAATLTLLLASVVMTPLADLFFLKVNGISQEMIQYIRMPLFAVVLVPATTVWRSFQRGYLLVERRTGEILLSETVEIAGLVIALTTTIFFCEFVGITAAAVSLLVSGLVGGSFMWFLIWRSHKSSLKNGK